MRPAKFCLYADYVVQGLRFQVYGGYGCDCAIDGNGAAILLIYSWDILPPLISALFYCRKSWLRAC